MLKIARPQERKGFWIAQTNTLIPLVDAVGTPLISDSQIQEVTHKALEKRGYTKEQIDQMIEQAEEQYEKRVLVKEASRYLKKLQQERAEHSTMRLISVGPKKWRLASLPGGR